MTREEAIEVVRKNLPHLGIGATEMTDALGTLIPELRESESEDEDERIRKWLIDYFKEVGKSWIHRDISPEQILAYLEKQKAQKKKNVLIWGDPQITIDVQKPEWSEEDEKMLRTIISDGSRGVELDSKQISFLKSIRPSWKPSEMNTNCQGCLYWTGKCKLPKGLDCPEKKEEQK